MEPHANSNIPFSDEGVLLGGISLPPSLAGSLRGPVLFRERVGSSTSHDDVAGIAFCGPARTAAPSNNSFAVETVHPRRFHSRTTCWARQPRGRSDGALHSRLKRDLDGCEIVGDDRGRLFFLTRLRSRGSRFCADASVYSAQRALYALMVRVSIGPPAVPKATYV